MQAFQPSTDSLTSKVIIVTGSTQGLGEYIAHRIAHLGARAVVVCGRNRDGGERVAQALTARGTSSIYVQADLSQEEDCRTIVRRCDEAFGRVDGLVNAAGLSTRGTLDNTSTELWNQLMNINARAPFLLTQESTRIMRREGIKGSIVNIISIVSYGGPPELMAYGSSKAALAFLTKNCAQALLDDHIRVNGLHIGWMETPGEHTVQRASGADEGWLEQAHASLPFKRMLHPKDVAPMVTYLLSDQAEMITGSLIHLDQTVPGAWS